MHQLRHILYKRQVTMNIYCKDTCVTHIGHHNIYLAEGQIFFFLDFKAGFKFILSEGDSSFIKFFCGHYPK